MAFHGVIPVCSNECEDMVISSVRRAVGYSVGRSKISSISFTSSWLYKQKTGHIIYLHNHWLSTCLPKLTMSAKGQTPKVNCS